MAARVIVEARRRQSAVRRSRSVQISRRRRLARSDRELWRLEVRVSALRPAGQGRRFRWSLQALGQPSRQRVRDDRSDDRGRTLAYLRRPEHGAQVIGLSRGVLNTKIYALVEAAEQSCRGDAQRGPGSRFVSAQRLIEVVDPALIADKAFEAAGLIDRPERRAIVWSSHPKEPKNRVCGTSPLLRTQAR